mmetsp:Transcript_7105/g.21910  ORF Transcript_7105/g.21910 Transcript_7105/m.21910 type:complete len:217 (-) Transcript_7105:309-959(-)
MQDDVLQRERGDAVLQVAGRVGEDGAHSVRHGPLPGAFHNILRRDRRLGGAARRRQRARGLASRQDNAARADGRRRLRGGVGRRARRHQHALGPRRGHAPAPRKESVHTLAVRGRPRLVVPDLRQGNRPRRRRRPRRSGRKHRRLLGRRHRQRLPRRRHDVRPTPHGPRPRQGPLRHPAPPGTRRPQGLSPPLQGLLRRLPRRHRQNPQVRRPGRP